MSTDTTAITEHLDTVANLETRYLTGGPADGETVVFFHDGAYGGAADTTWGEVLPLAAQRYSVVASDFLGYGGSAKSVRVDVSPFAFRIRHVFSLLDSLGITGPVHLVGNSFGGSVGLRALADLQYADRIASVTTINGTGGPWRSPRMAELGKFDGTEESLSAILDLLVDDFPGRAEHLAKRLEWAKTPGHFVTMQAPHLQVPEALQVTRPADPYPENLSGTGTPVLLVQGTRDVLLAEDWPAQLQAVVPHAEVVSLDHMHSPNITHPEEIWAVVADFLSRVDSGATS